MIQMMIQDAGQTRARNPPRNPPRKEDATASLGVTVSAATRRVASARQSAASELALRAPAMGFPISKLITLAQLGAVLAAGEENHLKGIRWTLLVGRRVGGDGGAPPVCGHPDAARLAGGGGGAGASPHGEGEALRSANAAFDCFLLSSRVR